MAIFRNLINAITASLATDSDRTKLMPLSILDDTLPVKKGVSINNGTEVLDINNNKGTGAGSNSFFGNGGKLITTAIECIAMGKNALLANLSGNSNTAIGHRSLEGNTTGRANSGLGANTLIANTTGQYNTAIGNGACSQNTEGSNNVMIGNVAGNSGPGVFNNNVLVGANVGNNGGTPYSGNTAVGYSAGNDLFGDGNVMLGAYAGSHELGSNSFYVNNVNRGDSNGDKLLSLMYGMFGAAAVNQFLQINGKFKVTVVNEYPDNAAALAASETIGTIYRTGDLLKVVH